MVHGTYPFVYFCCVSFSSLCYRVEWINNAALLREREGKKSQHQLRESTVFFFYVSGKLFRNDG